MYGIFKTQNLTRFEVATYNESLKKDTLKKDTL